MMILGIQLYNCNISRWSVWFDI